MDNSYTRKDWWKRIGLVFLGGVICFTFRNVAGDIETYYAWHYLGYAILVFGTCWCNVHRAEQLGGRTWPAIVLGILGPIWSLYYGIKRNPETPVELRLAA